MNTQISFPNTHTDHLRTNTTHTTHSILLENTLTGLRRRLIKICTLDLSLNWPAAECQSRPLTELELVAAPVVNAAVWGSLQTVRWLQAGAGDGLYRLQKPLT